MESGKYKAKVRRTKKKGQARTYRREMIILVVHTKFALAPSADCQPPDSI